MRRDFGCVEKQKHKNEAKAVGEYRKNLPNTQRVHENEWEKKLPLARIKHTD